MHGGERRAQIVARKHDESGELRVFGQGVVGSVGGVDEPRQLLTHDLQAAPSEVPLGLSRAGVSGVQKAIRLRRGPHEKLVSAEIDCFVDLDPAQKGVHMSRFPELFEEAIDEVVIGEAFLVEELAEHIAGHVLARQRALRAEVKIVASYPMARQTPVSELPTQEMVSLIGIAAASAAPRAASSASRRPASTPAPARRAWCASTPPSGSRGRVRRGGRRADPRARPARDAQPARPRHALRRQRSHSINAERLVEIVEGSMSSPIYELLKRPDELFVVEHAHLQPRFVEDSVRIALKRALDAYPELGRRRLPLRAPGQLRDDPHPRRRRRALRHRRRAARGARERRRGGAAHRAPRVA